MRRRLLGPLVLVLGVAALAAAAVPPIVYDEPLPWARDREAPPSLPPRRAEVEPKDNGGGVTVKTERFTFRFGGRKGEQGRDDRSGATRPATESAAPAPEPQPVPPPARASPLKPFTLTAVGLSLLGFLVGPFAWQRRSARPTATTGMALCCLALTWQYVAIGIAVGVAVAVLLMLLSAFNP